MTAEQPPRTTGANRPLAALVLGCVLSALAGLSAVGSSAGAATATASSYLLVGFADNDAIRNYDHLSQTAASTNVDWPMNLLFHENASINKVKNALQPEFDNTGNVMYARIKDGSSYVWDNDRGMKNPKTSCPTNIHARLFADSDDRMFNTVDGYYVVATSHFDIEENCPNERFGNSEDAEFWFRDEFNRERGYTVGANAVNVGNVEANRAEGNHHWQSNGWMSKVRIP